MLYIIHHVSLKQANTDFHACITSTLFVQKFRLKYLNLHRKGKEVKVNYAIMLSASITAISYLQLVQKFTLDALLSQTSHCLPFRSCGVL